MIVGESPIRHTPLYYTRGLPGSWDENWDFGNRVAANVFSEPWIIRATGKLIVKSHLDVAPDRRVLPRDMGPQRSNKKIS